MILKIKELQNNMSVIYKINYKNGKFYIGYTNDLKRRMSEHINAWKKAHYKTIQDCDLAIHEQDGLEEIEILEFVPDLSQLEQKEKYWIQFYNAYSSPAGYNKTPGGNSADQYGENSPVAIFSNEQVLDIRKRRFLGERKKDVYLDYTQYSFATFERVWLGRGYSDIGKEYIIPANAISRQEYSSKANSGLNNGRAKCSKEQIIEIRKRFDSGETITSIAKDFTHVSFSTVRRIAKREVYKNVE